MADIKQPEPSQEDLEFRIMEEEYRLRSHEDSIMKIAIDKKRIEIKKNKYDESIKEIEKSISKTTDDIANLKELLKKTE